MCFAFKRPDLPGPFRQRGLRRLKLLSESTEALGLRNEISYGIRAFSCCHLTVFPLILSIYIEKYDEVTISVSVDMRGRILTIVAKVMAGFVQSPPPFAQNCLGAAK